MFSKECLANQQLRNTGMKRVLNDGKITCHNDKALILELSHHFTHTLLYVDMGSVSMLDACVSWWDAPNVQIFTKFLIKVGDKTPVYKCGWSALSSNRSFSFFLLFYSQWSWKEQCWSSPEWKGHVRLAPKHFPGNKRIHTFRNVHRSFKLTFISTSHEWP